MIEEREQVPGMGCLTGLFKIVLFLALIGGIAIGTGVFIFIGLLAEILR